MTKEEVLEKLKEIVEPYVEMKDKISELNGDTDLINDLGVNSANVVDIVLDIESEFDILIEDEEINQMNTVSSAIDLIAEKTNA